MLNRKWNRIKDYVTGSGKKNKTGSIIGGSDGPTSIFIAGKRKNTKESAQYRNKLEKLAKELEPCEKSMTELVHHITKDYNGSLADLSDEEETIIKENILYTCYTEIMDELVPDLPGDLETARKNIQEWLQNRRKAVKKALEDTSGRIKFDIRQYEFPLIQEGEEVGKFYVQLDYVSEYVSTSFTCKAQEKGVEEYIHHITEDIQLYRGVSERDIKERNSRFMEYAASYFRFRHEARQTEGEKQREND